MVTGVNHLTWEVTDIEQSWEFYVNLLGMKPVMKSSWSAYFIAGDTWIAIVKGKRREDTRYDHIAFDLDRDKFEVLVGSLRKYGVEQWQENQSEGDSFYFLDPSCNRFELHCSDLAARIRQGKAEWDDEIVWYV